MDTLWLGTANAWECDEMGHLNVRHYLAKAEDALAALLTDREQMPRRVLRQHVRYHRETRAGTPLLIRGGVVAAGPPAIVYAEFLSPHDGLLRASIVTALAGDALPGPFIALPPHGAPRGLPDAPPRPAATLAQADEAGLREIYRGVIRRDQLDEHGILRPHQVVALISDGVAHLMMHLMPQRGDLRDGIGGGALEQRVIHRAAARLNDQVTIRSGVIAAGGKTMHFCHWLLNRQSGEAIATCEVVAVAFDLAARKALPLPGDVRARIDAMAVSVGA